MVKPQDGETEPKVGESEGVETPDAQIIGESQDKTGETPEKLELEDEISTVPDKDDQRRKSYEGMVKHFAEKIALGEKTLEEIPPKFRDKVADEYSETYGSGEEPSKIQELESKLNAIEEEKDTTEAKRLINDFQKGFSDGLDENAKKVFLDQYRDKVKSGTTKKDASKYAIGHLVELGYVPDVREAITEAKRAQGGKYYGAGAGVATKSTQDMRDFEAINAEMVKNGADPIKWGTYLKGKERGLF